MSHQGLEPMYGAINVPLAIFWTKPDQEKTCRELSCQAAADPDAWTGKLTIDERLWLYGKVGTMALYGERVAILEHQGDWLKVAAVSQRTTQNPLGYPGWIPAGQIALNDNYLEEQVRLKNVAVTAPKTLLVKNGGLGNSRCFLSYQTLLPLLDEKDASLEVRLPDGTRGVLSDREAKKTSGFSFSGLTIVEEARRFLGLPYLWGGTSGWGFDCSGFMFRLYQSQGISIPRDASEQAAMGGAVQKENLQPGDLLFFAKDKLAERIHHVGMYVGNGQMIHSPNSKSVIRIESYEAAIYGEEYWGARRYC